MREMYPEPFRTRAEPTWVNGTRVVRHDRLQLERWDVRTFCLLRGSGRCNADRVRSALGMRSWCHHDTNEMATDYAS